MTNPTLISQHFLHYLTPIPLVAILRGIQTHECEAVIDVLYESGFRCIEIPLNSPNALQSIELLAKNLPNDCLLGAGTVLSVESVQHVADAGGHLIVMPHCDIELITESHRRKLLSVPGVATISEAFAALKHGASALKLFPSESVAPSVLKNWRTVLPKETICLPVGGISPDHMKAYFEAGASGFGLGAALYQAGMTVDQVRNNAKNFVAALK
ncbi:2-dehydro-3-deoxy-6-phosphogalactonate aldolase [Solimicrobium silvestre]|uniref:2-keto-3-deoxy-6-phosphogluconate aldolase n=1 Tax=Solimicrobium silvestre TaxID=2099400 RepID=A0A2S9GXX2_9BURK|nr:2-dehydro-3-deoxy-6-phosphogalactonate aldolase [Solimicrobium silvestre]PRC92558.1 2-keto-3-deoxy-6-phosphogluconate aldolase [Solimicrobium silvestre]